MATIELGRIEGLFRYPVKSMRGEPLEHAGLGWHGVDGDRRLALRRVDDRSDFPWLTASKVPDLIRFTPRLPDVVVTPEGEALPLFGEALAADIGRRLGAPVQMLHFRNGLFDDATVSVITTDTVAEVCRLGGRPADVRRFRPNILVRSTRGAPFEEDAWVGGVLTFGAGADAPAVAVTARDLRCVMVNFDPDGGASAPEMLKAVARVNDTFCGAYATVTRAGALAVGQPVMLETK